ncbi:chloride channel [Hysterangium stoloniferum]|nr:chloride channel [Hysterangium stoloniferum]
MTETQLGPFAGPTSPHWRRTRLLSIGTRSTTDFEDRGATSIPQEPNDTTFLNRVNRSITFYGSTISMPTMRTQLASTAQRRSTVVGGLPHTHELFPPGHVSPRSLRARSSSFFRRSIAYDAPMNGTTDFPDDDNEAAKANGIRVWYSSFSSIDWLHDAIKDSNRIFKLRKRTSLRGRIRNAIDRSVGWIVVTIIGILAAVLAFMIVRSEQLLFDLKEGHCTGSWYKAKRFCCPVGPPSTLIGTEEDACDAWETWDKFFKDHLGVDGWFVEYITFAMIALCLALVSALLTVNFTASTSFVGKKDSGVLSPSFPQSTYPKAHTSSLTGGIPRKVIYFAAGSGIPEVKTILSGFVIHGYLGGRTLAVKTIGLALSVASGLSLGKEGPLVHISACVGNIISRYFPKYETNEGKRREILSAASAAGVAVAFGAPIGGVLFSLEEVSYFFPAKVMWRSFFCAIVAAVTLRFLDPFGTGKLVLFQVSYDKDWHAFELGFFVIIGVFGGVYGAYFSKMNFWWAKNVRGKTWLGKHPIFEVLLITSVTTAFCFLNPYTRLGGTELVYNLFAECHKGDFNEGLCASQSSEIQPLITAIGIAMIVKGMLTVVTFGIKLPAGIFIPTLGVGACFGRIVGLTVQYLQWERPSLGMFKACNGDRFCIIPGVYAMVGATAALSGVTRTTVSLAVIMVELTDTLTYVVPIMISVLVAKTVADALEPKGIYDLCIELIELPYLDGKMEHLWGGLQAGDAAVREVDAIYLERPNTVRQLRDQLQSVVSAGYGDGGLPILQQESGGSKMIGYIGVSELEHALTIVADDADAICQFYPAVGPSHDDVTSISSSYREFNNGPDLFDFTMYMDHAPLSVSTHAPLELVQQFFVKLGARYVVVTSSSGFFEGVIDKKHWVAFLDELDARRRQ